MRNWNEILAELYKQYLNYVSDNDFCIAAYDKNYILLGWHSEQNDRSPAMSCSDVIPSGGSSLKLASIYMLSEIGPCKLTDSECEDPDNRFVSQHNKAAYIGMSIADAPELQWLVLYAEESFAPPLLLGVCNIAAKLLSQQLSQYEHVKRLRDTVREQETIINHISDGLLVLDRDGILQYCNEPASKILKISINASVGRPIREVLDFELALNSVFKEQQGHIDRELQIESPTLRLHIIDTAIPIWDEHGTMISVVNTFREIERARQLSYRMTMDRDHYDFADISGNSPNLQVAITAARKAAQSTATVVLYGESGTGKELFAQAIHSGSAQKNGPFVAINCAALPRDLVESELFGYTPGSFTGADRAGRSGKFELASGGTLLLDEIAEMPLDVQAKLLRVLQERRVARIGAASSIAVDVRIIAASNQKLSQLVEDGSFREDLYYRLNVIEINIPALRERYDDIPLLLDQFLKKYCERLHRAPLELTPRAIMQLNNYHWPGNIRQLQNIAERLVHLSDDLEIDHIPPEWLNGTSERNDPLMSAPSTVPQLSLSGWEEAGVRSSLKAMDYNVTKTAAVLQISRPTLYAKMKQYGINLARRPR